MYKYIQFNLRYYSKFPGVWLRFFLFASKMEAILTIIILLCAQFGIVQTLNSKLMYTVWHADTHCKRDAVFSLLSSWSFAKGVKQHLSKGICCYSHLRLNNSHYEQKTKFRKLCNAHYFMHILGWSVYRIDQKKLEQIASVRWFFPSKSNRIAIIQV